jgi:hypothetical protein
MHNVNIKVYITKIQNHTLQIIGLHKMYFLLRENKYSTRVQCMRSVYDPEKKRGTPAQIASQDAFDIRVTDEVREKLTNEEIAQFEEWLSGRAEEKKKSRENIKLRMLKNNLQFSADVLNLGGRFEDDDVKENPDDIFAALDELKKALRKAGYKRPQKASKPSAPKDDRQASFITENTSESV